MAHQHEIELTTAQRDAITRDMSETQKKVLELRWGLDEKSEELEKLLAADKIDESAALARAAAVLDVEREIKQDAPRSPDPHQEPPDTGAAGQAAGAKTARAGAFPPQAPRRTGARINPLTPDSAAA